MRLPFADESCKPRQLLAVSMTGAARHGTVANSPQQKPAGCPAYQPEGSGFPQMLLWKQNREWQATLLDGPRKPQAYRIFAEINVRQQS